MIIRERVTIRSNDLKSYFELKARGYTTLWVGEGKICMQSPPAEPCGVAYNKAVIEDLLGDIC